MTQRILLILLIFVHSVFANLILDSEIESTLKKISAPLLRELNANNNNYNVYVINDKTINAFTQGGLEVFLYTGIIELCDDVEMLRGVIAHELSHVALHHVSSFDLQSKSALGTFLLSTALTFALLQNSNYTEDTASSLILGSMLGQHFGQREMLKYSRDKEIEADKKAIELMLKIKANPFGLYNSMNKIYEENMYYESFANQYETTHPLSRQRLQIMKDSMPANYIYKPYSLDQAIYKRARLKLIAFSYDPHEFITKYKNYKDDAEKYALAIAFHRIGKTQEGIKLLNELITKNPKDPYYHELKGQLLYENSDISSINEYKKALSLKQNDFYIYISYSGALIDFASQHKELQTELPKIKSQLKAYLLKNKYKTIILSQLKSIALLENNELLSQFYQAQIFYYMGDYQKAKTLAHKIKDKFTQNSYEKLILNDIISFISNN
jgi:predicted Zn-dependent protease